MDCAWGAGGVWGGLRNEMRCWRKKKKLKNAQENTKEERWESGIEISQQMQHEKQAASNSRPSQMRSWESCTRGRI